MNDESGTVSIQLARVRWRLNALDAWRKDIDARLAVMESKVNDLRFTDAVAQELAKKLDAQRHLRLSVMQKIGGGMFAVALVLIPVAVEKLTS